MRTSLRTGTNILSQFECLISLQVFVMSERRAAHGRRASTEDSTDQECAFPLQVPNRSTMWHKAPLHPYASRVLSAMWSKAPLSARELWPGLATTCSQGLAGRAPGISRSNNIDWTMFPQKGRVEILSSWSFLTEKAVQRRSRCWGWGGRCRFAKVKIFLLTESISSSIYCLCSIFSSLCFSSICCSRSTSILMLVLSNYQIALLLVRKSWIDTNSPLRKENLSFWSSLPRFHKRREFSPTNLTLET